MGITTERLVGLSPDRWAASQPNIRATSDQEEGRIRVISGRQSGGAVGRFRLAVLVAAAVAGVALPAAAAGKHKARLIGFVYTETNDPAGNKVVVFNRYADGRIKKRRVVATGGRGGRQSQPGCPSPCPIVDTQGEVELALGGRVLLVVNAGSNTISAFRVTPGGLKRADKKPSGGVFPNSLTSHGDLVYVLNSNSRNIAGFRLSPNGKLTAIKRSRRPLTSNASSGASRQVGFDNSGRILVVTLFMPGGTQTTVRAIDTFVVRANGTPGPARGYNTSSAAPFGFAFDPRHNHLVVTHAPASVATYKVTRRGAVTAVDTQPSHGDAPCWVQITRNGRYAYIVNSAGAPSVSEFALARNGKLTFLGRTRTIAGENDKNDSALSPDSKYLYVLAPGVTAGPSHIDVYKVRKNGTLKLIQMTSNTLNPGVSGMAAG
jgi:6-phosphogluconolactonase (cycloisomerase 2 family)